ncbi:MAG: hypothetical protein QM538_00995 [Methylacidiphilales bacterium]|nr:hypothetical protein [Candidatus Methylacidiphilales bacterium]
MIRRFITWQQKIFKRRVVETVGYCNPTYSKLYIIPTPIGIIFGILIFVQLLAAYNYGNNIVYAYAFIHTSWFLFAIIKNFTCGLFVEIDPVFPYLVQAHSPFCITLKIPKLKRETSLVILLKATDENYRLYCTTAKQTSLSINLFSNQRGIVSIPEFVVSTTSPFGLTKTYWFLKCKNTIPCYPKPIGIPLHLLISQQSRNIEGVEFQYHRDWIESDSLSKIDWRIYFKNRKKFSKVFSNSSNSSTLLFDFDSLHGDTETRLSQLCLWIIEANKLRKEYTVQLQKEFYRSGIGDIHTNECLVALSRFKLPC